MPINRFVLILLALSAIFAIAVLRLSPATAQEPAGITLTPTKSEETATPTEPEVTPTNTEPVVSDTPTPSEEVTITPTLPVETVTATSTPTEGLTIPPPFDTGTPTPDEPGSRATRTPPVLPATGQSPIGGGFPVEGLFAALLLALVGWFFLRGLIGGRAQK